MKDDIQNTEVLLWGTSQPLTAADWTSKRAAIESYISLLIERDFSRLVELLYRIDINERQLKALVAATNNTDSAALITDLIIERQLQKIASRQSQPPADHIPEEDRW
jgi:hypothetical protein